MNPFAGVTNGDAAFHQNYLNTLKNEAQSDVTQPTHMSVSLGCKVYMHNGANAY